MFLCLLLRPALSPFCIHSFAFSASIPRLISLSPSGKYSPERNPCCVTDYWPLKVVCFFTILPSLQSNASYFCVTFTKITAEGRLGILHWKRPWINLVSADSKNVQYHFRMCCFQFIFLLFCLQLRWENNWLQNLNSVWPEAIGLPHWEPLQDSMDCPGVKTDQKEVGRLLCCRQQHEDSKHAQHKGGRNIDMFLFDEPSWQTVSDGLHRTIFTTWIHLIKKTKTFLTPLTGYKIKVMATLPRIPSLQCKIAIKRQKAEQFWSWMFKGRVQLWLIKSI